MGGRVWRRTRTFVGELGDGALDGERIARLELLVHVLAHHALLVLLDEQHDLALVLRARNRRIRAHGQVALLIEGRARRTLGRTHDDERRDGRERGGVGPAG